MLNGVSAGSSYPNWDVYKNPQSDYWNLGVKTGGQNGQEGTSGVGTTGIGSEKKVNSNYNFGSGSTNPLLAKLDSYDSASVNRPEERNAENGRNLYCIG